MPPLTAQTSSSTATILPNKDSVSSRLATHYGASTMPTYVEGKSLKEAIRDANAAAKYCLVYLHAGDHEDTAHFVRQILMKEHVQKKISEIAIMFLVDAYSKEGTGLEAQWDVTQFPYCCMLVKGRVIGDLQGRFDEADFLEFITQCDDVARPIIHQEAAFMYERTMREQLRLQQEQEMAEAERIDREKLAAAKKAEADRKQAQIEAERLEAAEKAARIERERAAAAEKAERERREAEERAAAEAKALELEIAKATAASALPSEPPEDADATTIAKIRLVDLKGRPNNRNFYRSDLVRTLYTYAKTIEGYDGTPFDLMAGFPPKALNEAEADTLTIGEVPALVPRSVVTMKAL